MSDVELSPEDQQLMLVQFSQEVRQKLTELDNWWEEIDWEKIFELIMELMVLCFAMDAQAINAVREPSLLQRFGLKIRCRWFLRGEGYRFRVGRRAGELATTVLQVAATKSDKQICQAYDEAVEGIRPQSTAA